MLFRGKENFIFTLIIDLNKNLNQKSFVLATVQTCYAVELFLLFLLVINPDHWISSMLFQSFGLLILLAALLVTLLLQLFVVMKWRVHFQLYNQFLFFRYIVFPLLVFFLCAEIRQTFYFPILVSYLLLTIFTLFTIFICCTVFHQYSQNTVAYSSSEYSKFYVLTDVLMLLLLPSQSGDWIWTILLLWAALVIAIRVKIKNQTRGKTTDKIMGFIGNVKGYFLLIMIGRHLIFSQSFQSTVLACSFPVIFLLLAYEFCRGKKFILNPDVLIGEAPLSQYFDFIYKISADLSEFKTNLNLNFKESYLMLMISLHQKSCKQASCLLLQSSTREQLLNCNQPSNRRTLIYKVIKTIQTLFQLYQKKLPSNKQLQIFKLQFYSVHVVNRVKIKHIFAELDFNQLGIKDKLIALYSKQRAETTESIEILDSSSSGDPYDEFKRDLLDLLVLLRQFWSILREERIDINNLIRLSEKLFPLKKQLESSWKRKLKEETFATWNILKTYSLYCRTILHDITRSCILEDYCHILEERLRNKQELFYVKFQCETGVIMISLSESSLGHIFSVNRIASNLFNYYDKKTMMSLRVNQIQPKVFSVFHDSILNSFLKDRYKRINQDQRYLWGKNKNGFIFPFHISLRKLTWNTNDELIFISSVKPVKLKEAPILVIVDPEGDIIDVSSTFAWCFLKRNEVASAFRNKNIQQLLPTFFQVVEEKLAKNQTKFNFEQHCPVKKNNACFDVKFSGFQLSIRGSKVGYLLQGKKIEVINTLQQKKKIAQLFVQNAQYKNTYNPFRLCFQLANKSDSFYHNSMQEFMFPFMKTSDIEKMFRLEESKAQTIIYGQDIKTFRLVNNRIELAIDEESFMSDVSEGFREISVLKKIQKMREDTDNKKNTNITNVFKIVITTASISLILFSLLLIISSLKFNGQSTIRINAMNSKITIRYLLPQILIYTYFPVALKNSSFLLTLREQFITALDTSEIQEWQKENMLILLKKADSKDNISFAPNLFDFKTAKQSIHIQILIFLYIEVILLVVYLLGLFCMFYYFQHSLHDTYSIFLSVEDKKLQTIQQQTKKLIDILSEPTNEPKKIDSPAEIIEQAEQQAQQQRIRRFKRNQKLQNLNLAFKLVLPTLVLFLFTIFCAIFMNILIARHNQDVEIWKQAEEVLPDASLATAQSLFKYLNMSGQFNEPTHFYTLQQQYESNLMDSHLDKTFLIHLLKGPPCDKETYDHELPHFIQHMCQDQNLKDQNNLASDLNFLSTFLKQPSTYNYSIWQQIIGMQFDYLKPFLKYIMLQIMEMIENQRNTLINNFKIMGIIIICLTAASTIYQLWDPINEMDDRIVFTKDLMSIIPSEKQKRSIETLVTLTTEAIQFRQYED